MITSANSPNLRGFTIAVRPPDRSPCERPARSRARPGCHLFAPSPRLNVDLAGLTLRSKLKAQSMAHERLDITHERLDITHERLDMTHERRDMTHERLDATHERLDMTHERLEATHERLDITYERLEATHERLEATHEARIVIGSTEIVWSRGTCVNMWRPRYMI